MIICLANLKDDISAAVHGNIRSSQPIAGAEAKKYGKINASDISVDCNDPIQADLSFILKYKSIFKCRLCPKVVCLSEETVKRHLSSKVTKLHTHTCIIAAVLDLQ